MKKSDTVVIGASAAGLACAACLKKENLEFIILEQHPHVAHAWRNHYDRLHLHTNKSSSDLPYLSYPKSFPKYPSRDQVVAYLELYAQEMGIQPVFNTKVVSIEKTKEGWSIKTNKETYLTNHVIVSTGDTNKPHIPRKEGIESFPGKILHSSAYKNGREFKDQDVLVVGFGNSACEIAICVHEHGGRPALSVRSEVNVIPREVLGIPALQIGILQTHLPAKLADTLNQPVIDLLIGDIQKLGLKKAAYGPIEQMRKYHKIPLLDIGTIQLIKEGKIKVFPDITAIEQDVIHFEDHRQQHFDAIIMATGYDTGLSDFVKIDKERLEDLEKPFRQRKEEGKDNLYFCGFYVSPTGMLREVGIEAREIARRIKKGDK